MFAPTFVQEDIVSLGRFQFYLSLMIDDVGSKPFSATGIAPLPKPEISYRVEVIDSSRQNFARPRADVEKFISDWHGKQFETNRQQKQTEKRVQKFGPNSSPSRPALETEEKPAKIVIADDLKQTIMQAQKEEREEKKPPIVSHVSIPQPKAMEETGQVKKEFSQSKSEKAFKPKTPFVQKAIPSQVKEFLKTVEEEKPQVSNLPRISKKEASQENKNSLREALAFALKQTQEKPKKQEFTTVEKTQSRKTLSTKDKVSLEEIVIEAENILMKYNSQDKDIENNFDTKIHYDGDQNTLKHKEIPEDVLRSILD